ncbi:MAG: M14 family metallopeptidase [Acidobacteriota bacterium]
MRYQTKIILSAAFILLFSLVFQVNTQDHFYLQLISFDKSSNIYERLKGLELDFLMEWERKIYALAAPEILLQLEYKGISYSLASLPGNQFPTQFSSLSSINGAYHSYGELERDLKQLSDSYPQICSLISLGTSLENRNIYALKISDNVAIEENEARVLFLGCHHAREWISVEIPFLIAKHLVENYHSNPAIKNLVDRAEIWFVPMVNPDGLEYSIHFYRYWRKNRRTHGNGQFGVDLNRNYSYQWGYDNSGSSPDPSSDVYRGKSAFSEPESFAVKKLGEQTTFHALISYHSYSQVILYPWGYTTQQAPGKTLMESLASKMSEAMEKVNGRKYSWGQTGSSLYLTNGDTIDWVYGNFGIPAFTIELPPVDLLRGGFFNAESDIQLIFEENLPAALILIEWTTETFNESILNQAERLKPS